MRTCYKIIVSVLFFLAGCPVFSGASTPNNTDQTGKRASLRTSSKQIALEDLSLYKLLLIMQSNIERLYRDSWTSTHVNVALQKQLDLDQNFTIEALRLMHEIVMDFNEMQESHKGSFYYNPEILLKFVSTSNMLDLDEGEIDPHNIRSQRQQLELFSKDLALYYMNKKDLLDDADRRLLNNLTSFYRILIFGLLRDEICMLYLDTDFITRVIDYCIYRPIECINRHKLLAAMVVMSALGGLGYYYYYKYDRNAALNKPFAGAINHVAAIRQSGAECAASTTLVALFAHDAQDQKQELMNLQLLDRHKEKIFPLLHTYVQQNRADVIAAKTAAVMAENVRIEQPDALDGFAAMRRLIDPTRQILVGMRGEVGISEALKETIQQGLQSIISLQQSYDEKNPLKIPTLEVLQKCCATLYDAMHKSHIFLSSDNKKAASCADILRCMDQLRPIREKADNLIAQQKELKDAQDKDGTTWLTQDECQTLLCNQHFIKQVEAIVGVTLNGADAIINFDEKRAIAPAVLENFKLHGAALTFIIHDLEEPRKPCFTVTIRRDATSAYGFTATVKDTLGRNQEQNKHLIALCNILTRALV